MDSMLKTMQAFDIQDEYNRFSEVRDSVVAARQEMALMETELEEMAQTLFENMIAKMAVSFNEPTHKVKLIVLYRLFTEDSGDLAEDKASVEDILDLYGIN